MRTCFISILFLITWLGVAIGQGAYLQRGVSGFGVDAGFNTTKDAFSYGAGIGYSISGIFDIGVEVARINPKDSEEDIYMIDLVPSIAFYLTKQDESMPFTSMLGAQYEYAPTFGDLFDSSREMITKLYSAGASLFRSSWIGQSLTIQQSIYLLYSQGHILYREDNQEEKEQLDAFTFGLGLSFIIRSTPNVIVIHPGLSVTDGIKMFSLGLGFVFSKSQLE